MPLYIVIDGDMQMNKERVRISLDVSKELGEKIKEQAEKHDMTVNAFIRIALKEYLKEVAE